MRGREHARTWAGSALEFEPPVGPGAARVPGELAIHWHTTNLPQWADPDPLTGTPVDLHGSQNSTEAGFRFADEFIDIKLSAWVTCLSTRLALASNVLVDITGT